MFIRNLAIFLVAIVAMPLAARAGGDFRLIATGTRNPPSVYGWSGCRETGASGPARQAWATCTKGGGITIRQSYANPQSSACELRTWETGVFKFTWHAEFKKNDNNVCSMRWRDDDTLDVDIRQ